MPRPRYDRVGAVRYAFLLALASFLPGNGSLVASAKQNAPLPATSAVGVPEFAKDVRVKVAGSDVPLGDIVRQRASDPQIARYRELRKANDGSVDSQR